MVQGPERAQIRFYPGAVGDWIRSDHQKPPIRAIVEVSDRRTTWEGFWTEASKRRSSECRERERESESERKRQESVPR